jgi:hypothetical protein
MAVCMLGLPGWGVERNVGGNDVCECCLLLLQVHVASVVLTSPTDQYAAYLKLTTCVVFTFARVSSTCITAISPWFVQ